MGRVRLLAPVAVHALFGERRPQPVEQLLPALLGFERTEVREGRERFAGFGSYSSPGLARTG